MKSTIAIIAVAAAVLAACERPSNTAYNNSGQSAAGGNMPATEGTREPAAASPPASTSTATSDTASPNVAPTGAAPADETATSTKIMTAISSDPGMKDADVTVKTENGVVTLGGSAKSQDQVALATGIATKQPGVSKVESQIALN